MQNEGSQKIIARFFEALAMLKAQKVIRGKKTFTDRYNINRWNMNTLEKHRESDMFQTEWLEFLVRDYGISASWLLTGDGAMFSVVDKPVVATKKARTSKKIAAL